MADFSCCFLAYDMIIVRTADKWRIRKMDLYEGAVVKKYMTLVEALKCLPGVMPNKSKKLIDDAFEISYVPGSMEISDLGYRVGETKLSQEEYKAIHIEVQSFYGTTIRISPQGAKVLMKLYRNGDLVMHKGKSITESTELQAYIDKESALKKEADRIRREDERKKYLVENPDKIKEADFSYSLLDSVFYRKFGAFRGYKTMILDGIEVEKSVFVYQSNSGKTHDSEVTFSWTDSKGEPHRLCKPSLYSENRRNDANRNWGLPE